MEGESELIKMVDVLTTNMVSLTVMIERLNEKHDILEAMVERHTTVIIGHTDRFKRLEKMTTTRSQEVERIIGGLKDERSLRDDMRRLLKDEGVGVIDPNKEPTQGPQGIKAHDLDGVGRDKENVMNDMCRELSDKVKETMATNGFSSCDVDVSTEGMLTRDGSTQFVVRIMALCSEITRVEETG